LLNSLLKDYKKMDFKMKLKYLNQSLYGESEDQDEQYVVILNIMAAISNFDLINFRRFMAAYFHSWYLNKEIGEGEPGQPDFIAGHLDRFLGCESDEYILSLSDLIVKKSKNTLREVITDEIVRRC